MCTRFTLTARPADIARLFGLADIHDFPPRYNIAPEQPVGIVRVGYTGAREFVLVRWGLLPGWVKEPGEFALLVNARSESLAEKPSFTAALRYRRCLVPMTGYYLWAGESGARQPWHVAAQSSEAFGVAGLWETWMGADGSEIDTAAIVTVEASRPLAALGGRMPAILAPKDYAVWLDCRSGDAAAALRLLRPAVDDLLRVMPVAKAVNNPRNDGPDLLRPATEVPPE